MTTIDTSRNFLVLLPNTCVCESDVAYQELIHNFCGRIVSPPDLPRDQSEINIYLCGDLDKWPGDVPSPTFPQVIREFSYGYWESTYDLIPLGRVPILVHGVGVYFRQFFTSNLDYFNEIKTTHAFQYLTESNKPSKALRKGIYLTPVKMVDDELHFHLLRCSSNLTGPTENFREIDEMIVDSLNTSARQVFQEPSELNHVLAQIYENRQIDRRENKARIKAHSDKTKDMPSHGLIAFCTFYDSTEFTYLKRDGFDYRYRETSGLTRLHFRLKDDALGSSGAPTHLVRDFNVTLYPNSVFMISLSVNRWYTHEICPSLLNIPRIPTRMGYVVRCSDTSAVHRDGQTYIVDVDQYFPLVPATHDSMESLRELYRRENLTAEVVNYGLVTFSMNQGDYLAPIY